MLDRLDRLPAPQQEALAAAFGLSRRTRSGSLPRRSRRARPAVRRRRASGRSCAWSTTRSGSTRASAQVARVRRSAPRGRVGRDGVRGSRAVRRAELDGLPELVVERAGRRRTRVRCWRSAVPGPAGRAVRDRIVAETRGNPLALLELPRGLTATRAGGRVRTAGRARAAGADRGELLRRLDATAGRRRGGCCCIAAAEPVGDPLLVWRAAERLGVGCRGGRLRRRTPGCSTIGDASRSAIRWCARRSTAPRRPGPPGGAPRPGRGDRPGGRPGPSRLAPCAAAAGPDEEVAVGARAVGRAGAGAWRVRRGGGVPPARRRADRATRRGAPNGRSRPPQASLQAGAFDAALGLLADGGGRAARRAAARPGRPAARRDRVRPEPRQRRAAAAAPRGATLEPLDATLARETYLDAWSAALFAGRLADGGGLRDVSRAARAAPRRRATRAPSDLLLDGFALLLHRRTRRSGAGAAARASTGLRRHGRVRSRRCCAGAGSRRRPRRRLGLRHAARRVADAQVELARELGCARACSPSALNVARARPSRWPATSAGAASLVAEADAVSEATGTRRPAPYGALVLAGLRGREAEAVAADRRHRSGRPTAAGQGTAVAVRATGRARSCCNGLGRYDEALAAASAASDDAPSCSSPRGR